MQKECQASWDLLLFKEPIFYCPNQSKYLEYIVICDIMYNILDTGVAKTEIEIVMYDIFDTGVAKTEI